MTAAITEHSLGTIPWVVLTGPRVDAFRLLGEHQADRIRAMAGESEAMLQVRSRTADPRVRSQLASVAEYSRDAYPQCSAELEAMASGAGVAIDDLLLLNLRGDIGTGEVSGCTDVALAGPGCAVIGHNEDGFSELVELSLLLTLALDDSPGVTAWWYPGFLPANTWAANELGLAWGIDHIGVKRPAPAPGRHFVARELHRCRSLPEFSEHLRRHASAGGFAFTAGEFGSGNVTQVEAAAGQFAERAPAAEREMLWHTNHLRYLPDLDVPHENSRQRAQVAGGWSVDWDRPADWCIEVLARRSLPRGVHRDGTGRDQTVTVVTMVADLVAGEVVFSAHGAEPTAIPWRDLVRGVPDRQRPFLAS